MAEQITKEVSKTEKFFAFFEIFQDRNRCTFWAGQFFKYPGPPRLFVPVTESANKLFLRPWPNKRRKKLISFRRKLRSFLLFFENFQDRNRCTFWAGQFFKYPGPPRLFVPVTESANKLFLRPWPKKRRRMLVLAN